MPSGSSLTKFVAIASQSRMCVCVCVCVLGCSAVAKGEEASDSLAILQAGKGFPPKLANPSKSVPAC